MKTSLILFDIDGTLLTSGGAGEYALRLGFQDAFSLPEDFSGIEISGRTDSGIARQVFQKHGVEPNEENLNRYFQGYLCRLQEQIPQRPGRVLPGVRALLDALAARSHVSLGLLTGNLERGARIKLRHYGVDEPFGFGAFADDHHDRDELAKLALSRACARHSVEFCSNNSYVIGDTPHDIRCARACGARAIAVATGSFTMEQLAEHQPDALFADLTDLHAVLRALGEGA